MIRRHLSNDEQAIRRSRGIPLWRLLPFALPVIVFFVMSTDQELFRTCIGRPLYEHGRGAAWGRLIVAIACSPYYVRDFSQHWVAVSTFFAGIVLAIPQTLWIKRHTAYWNSVRKTERRKRAEGKPDAKVPPPPAEAKGS